MADGATPSRAISFIDEKLQAYLDERFQWVIQRLVDMPNDRARREWLQRIENFHDKDLQARVPREGPEVLKQGLAHQVELAMWARLNERQGSLI